MLLVADWDVPSSGDHKWIAGRAETMENHLRFCTSQPDNVQELAERTHNTKQQWKLHKSLAQSDVTGAAPIAGPSRLPQISTPSLPASTSPFFCHPDLHTASPFSLASLSTLPSPSSEALLCPPSSTFLAAHIPLPPSRSVSPSASHCFYSASSVAPSLSHQSSVSYMDPLDFTAWYLFSLQQWTALRQEHFEQGLMRITASCGFPLTWVMNPEVLLFMQEFVHAAAVVPTHYTLTCRILPGSLADLHAKRDKAIAELNNCNSTLQFDGWTALNHHHYDAFMLSLDSQVCRHVFYCFTF